MGSVNFEHRSILIQNFEICISLKMQKFKLLNEIVLNQTADTKPELNVLLT